MTSRQYYLKETRREFLKFTGTGIGALGLASALNNNNLYASPSTDSLSFLTPHFLPKAKNVIYIHLVGGPSHLELFDHKPELIRRDGQKCPDHMFKGKQLAFIRDHPTLLGTRFKYNKYGQGGLELSEHLPLMGKMADHLAVVKTVHTEQFNHAPAQLFLHTGFERFGRPGIGSWVSYGLGSENSDLPNYVVLITGSVAGAGNSLWGSGFLPTLHQGVEFRSQGDPVLFLSNPKGISAQNKRDIISGINFLNETALADIGDPEIATRISQYELAYRMQASVPELMSINSETSSTLEAYGAKPDSKSFANNCLLARRLVERGVRFVQLFDQGWDHHSGLFDSLPKKARQLDRPVAALIADLRERGLLDETLIVIGAEFGRTPMLQGLSNNRAANNIGRDHHKEAYSMVFAGGGIRGGTSYGETDELGYQAIENPVHVHDINATILHQLGLNHERLTFKYQGREFRLTDVHGDVINGILT
ncbi:MAG: sulfatase [Verrucomicrobiales bacterium]|nr:sulfatase [Verrucomicrobiales bacterium]